MEYRGHYSFQNVRPQRILQALQWLKANNKLNENETLNQSWELDSADDGIDAWNELTCNITECEDQINKDEEENEGTGSSSESEQEDKEIVPKTTDESQNVQLETCIHLSDLSIDASRIISIAPGEGRKPLSILQDTNFEELSFPTLFPTRQFCEGKLNCQRRNISVALRKSLNNHDGEACNAGFFRNSEFIRPLIPKDDFFALFAGALLTGRR